MEYGYVIADRYVCRKPLGSGANGSVYLAYDNKLCKYWAVKACNSHSEAEIYALKSIDYYAFPRIVDVIEQDSTEYIVMDYIEGISLSSYIRLHSVTEKQVIRWGQEIALALSYLHSMNPAVYYTDCKPDNIMLTPSMAIRIVDLGSIFINDSKEYIISSSKFYAPKELELSKPSVSSDVYSLGMTLYRLITRSVVEYRDKKGNLRPEHINKNISPALSNIIRRCSNKSPNKRFQSMKDVYESLYSISNVKLAKKYLIKSASCVFTIFSYLLKSILALSVIISSKLCAYERPYIPIILFLLLLFICQKPKYYSWETCKEIVRCSAPAIILFLLLWHYNDANTVFAKEKDVPNTERLDITLYDEKFRKTLIRPGTVWHVEDDVFLSISSKELLSEDCLITISCSKNSGEKTYEFLCQADH